MPKQRISAEETEYYGMAFTTDTLALLDSLKMLIESNVIGTQATSVTTGIDEITVETTCAYADGDYVLIYDPTAIGETEGYERQVMARDANTLWLSDPIDHDIPTATVIRRIGNNYLKGLYTGNPPVQPSFPCILIDANVIDDSPFALEGTSNATYAVTVSIFTDGPTYDDAHRSAWTIAKQIEQCLTYQINPDPCRCIWKWKLTDITQDAQVNESSTLKAIHIHLTYEELLQRLQKEIPIIQAMTNPDFQTTRVESRTTTVSAYPTRAVVSVTEKTTVNKHTYIVHTDNGTPTTLRQISSS